MHTNDLFRYSPDTDISNDDTDSDTDPIHQNHASRQPYTGIKEQMYQVSNSFIFFKKYYLQEKTRFNHFLPFQDKLSELKRQLAQLNEGTHPEWMKKLKRLENSYKERMRINAIIRDLVRNMCLLFSKTPQLRIDPKWSIGFLSSSLYCIYYNLYEIWYGGKLKLEQDLLSDDKTNR